MAALKLAVAPEAERDITEAYLWYEDRRTGLGEEFVRAVDACLESIRRQPEIYPVVHEAYRRALTRRFPYAVFYEYEGSIVTIYARDPDKWHRRLG